MKSAYSALLLASLLGTAAAAFQIGYIFANTDKTWIDAQNYCRERYLDLVRFDSNSNYISFEKIMDMYLDRQNWIGLSKPPNTTKYEWWSDGTPVKFTNWDYKEPNYLTTQHCVMMVSTGEWVTSDCAKALTFFCYDCYPRVILVNESKTWEEALRHCRTFYTDLISLNTVQDFSVFSLNKYFGHRNTSAWTGLRFMNGFWFWVNKDALGRLVKPPSCPASPYHCGALVIGTTNLENRNCMEKMRFACYHEW